MYEMTEEKYKQEALDYLSKLPKKYQQLAAVSIQEVLDSGLSWRWVNTALRKKSESNWQRYGGFGLMFNKNFRRAVYEQMEREDYAASIDLNEFFGGDAR